MKDSKFKSKRLTSVVVILEIIIFSVITFWLSPMEKEAKIAFIVIVDFIAITLLIVYLLNKSVKRPLELQGDFTCPFCDYKGPMYVFTLIHKKSKQVTYKAGCPNCKNLISFRFEKVPSYSGPVNVGTTISEP